MAKKLLSIDIREDVVCAVMLSTSGKISTVVGCGISVHDGNPFPQAVEAVLQQVKYKGEPCRVSLGAENFFFRNLTFPFTDKRKIDKILPIELEDQILVDMEDVIADSLVTGEKGSTAAVVAAMVDRNFLRQRLDELAELNIDPVVVTVSGVQTALQLAKKRIEKDFVLLDVGCKRVTMFVMAAGKMRLVRTMVFDDGGGANFIIDKNSQLVSARRPGMVADTFKSMCKDINHTLFALEDAKFDLPIFLTGPLTFVQDSAQHLKKNLGRRVTPCDLSGMSVDIGKGSGLWRADLMTSPLTLAIRSKKSQSGFNFRKNEFAKRASFRRYRHLVPRVGIPLLICCLLGIGYLWNNYYQRQRELASLDVESREIFTATLPDVKRVIDPVQQLTIEIRDLKKGMLGDAGLDSDIKVIDMLAELSTRIPESLQVHVVRMVVDRQTILLRGLTDNFNSVDGLKKALEKSDYFRDVTINSANLATKVSGVRFELKLDLNKG
jgi:general secretion pathway protein L